MTVGVTEYGNRCVATNVVTATEIMAQHVAALGDIEWVELPHLTRWNDYSADLRLSRRSFGWYGTARKSTAEDRMDQLERAVGSIEARLAHCPTVPKA